MNPWRVFIFAGILSLSIASVANGQQRVCPEELKPLNYCLGDRVLVFDQRKATNPVAVGQLTGIGRTNSNDKSEVVVTINTLFGSGGYNRGYSMSVSELGIRTDGERPVCGDIKTGDIVRRTDSNEAEQKVVFMNEDCDWAYLIGLTSDDSPQTWGFEFTKRLKKSETTND